MSANPTITLSWGLDIVDAAGTDPHTLHLTGRLGTRGAAMFREWFSTQVEPQAQVSLNLDAVDYISSAGIAALRDQALRLKAGGGALVVVAASEPVRMALQLAGVAELRVTPQAETSALPSGAR